MNGLQFALAVSQTHNETLRLILGTNNSQPRSRHVLLLLWRCCLVNSHPVALRGRRTLAVWFCPFKLGSSFFFLRLHWCQKQTKGGGGSAGEESGWKVLGRATSGCSLDAQFLLDFIGIEFVLFVFLLDGSEVRLSVRLCERKDRITSCCFEMRSDYRARETWEGGVTTWYQKKKARDDVTGCWRN